MKRHDGPKNDPEANRRLVRTYLVAAAHAVVFIPALFYLRFGEVNAFALSFTGFVVVLCLLVALGYYVTDKPEYHTTAAPKGGLLDRVGAFWLLACAFGPFFGWVVTTTEIPLTEGNWRWRYVVRVALSVGLPILTALPLLVYVRGRYWYVAMLLLFGVTALPVWSAVNTMLDLRDGPVVQRAIGYYDAPNFSFRPDTGGRPFTLRLLRHTGRAVKIAPSANSP